VWIPPVTPCEAAAAEIRRILHMLVDNDNDKC
jgi:hypothetical protein